jgi:hypothetical protein
MSLHISIFIRGIVFGNYKKVRTKKGRLMALTVGIRATAACFFLFKEKFLYQKSCRSGHDYIYYDVLDVHDV